MNRRAFFGMIAAGVAAAADPERLLWVPGRKLISVPRDVGIFQPHRVVRMTMCDALPLNEIVERYIRPAASALACRIDQCEAVWAYSIFDEGYVIHVQNRPYRNISPHAEVSHMRFIAGDTIAIRKPPRYVARSL